MANNECTCAKCRDACNQRPCWPTPCGARRIIKAGFGDKLMLEWSQVDRHSKIIYMVCPAIVGYEKSQAPFVPVGKCAFLDDNERCMLHELGLKPYEGKMLNHEEPTKIIARRHNAIALGWNNKAARRIVKEWRNNHGVKSGHRKATVEDRLRLDLMGGLGSLKELFNAIIGG